MAESSVIGLLRRMGQVLFHNDDKFAWLQGWRIQSGQFGLSRSYRHPNFDQLALCSECHGWGLRSDGDCARCSGTGRVTLGHPSASAGR